LDIVHVSTVKVSSSLHFRTPLAIMQVSARPQSLRRRLCTTYLHHLLISRTGNAQIPDSPPSIPMDRVRAEDRVAQAAHSFFRRTVSHTAMGLSVAIVSLLPVRPTPLFPTAGVPYHLLERSLLYNSPVTRHCRHPQTRSQRVKARR
jgi:hypothetical protein